MRILMSIQTKYARKIFSGRKQWEFRKSVPREAIGSLFPVTVVVYSAGEDRTVIGEFRVSRVVSTSFDELMRVTGAASDPNAIEWLSHYYGQRRLCNAIEVGPVKLYNEPIALSELQRRVPAFRPPQNFIYLHNHPDVDAVLRTASGETA